jgi:ATP-dependent Clp protease ATP-binding subunit ClpA
MYELFTDRARKVMQLANQEAQRFNHEYVGTEHILLGLVKESSGVGGTVLRNLGVDLRKIRLEVEKVVPTTPNDEQATGRLPHTPRAKKVIEYSIEEARNLNHNHVGTEHLLLGLLREQEGVAAQVLRNLGLKLEDVREEIISLLTGNKPSSEKPAEQGERLSIPFKLPSGKMIEIPWGWPWTHFWSLNLKQEKSVNQLPSRKDVITRITKRRDGETNEAIEKVIAILNNAEQTPIVLVGLNDYKPNAVSKVVELLKRQEWRVTQNQETKEWEVE